MYIQISLGVSGGTKCQQTRTWNTVKRGNTKVLGEERGGSGGAAERRRRRNGEWATRRWRHGGRVAPQTTERRGGRTSWCGAVETTQGGARPAKIQRRRPTAGQAQTGGPKWGAASKKSSGQHPMGTNKTSKRGRERKSKMAQAANENKQTEALVLRRLEDGCGVGTRRAGEGAGVASPAEHCAGVRPTDSSA